MHYGRVKLRAASGPFFLDCISRNLRPPPLLYGYGYRHREGYFKVRASTHSPRRVRAKGAGGGTVVLAEGLVLEVGDALAVEEAL